MPPPEPVHPRGFDFARFAWFEGIGAVGFAYTLPEEISPPGMNAATLLANLRISIGDRIRGVIGGVSGSVAAALVNGERASIPDRVSDELRASGIYHVLSISGLHMVLFGGSLFWISRVFFVLIPGLALRYPIRKWAAAVALVGATFYLLISGAEVATQRAWIMIALMFVAMLLDRPALSMRNVMLAAVLILLWRPESLLGASFQMSFAAVIALIAFYESKTVKRWVFPSQRDRGFLIAAPRWLFAYALGTALTSIIAGMATGVIAAYHFNRIAVYGLAGNMAIMPFVGILVMPMALLSLVLMPFGLEAPALWIMEIGIDGMLAVAHEVASWQGADRLIREAPFHALMLAIGGGLWLVIWREKWRYLGLFPIILGLVMWDMAPRYDVLVDRDAALFAVRNAEGQLALTAARPAYAAENWLRMEGDGRKPREAANSEMLRCDVAGCAYQEAGKKVIAIPMTLDGVAEDCAIATIVIAKVPVPRSMRKECGADLLLDYFYFWRNGATGIILQDDGGISIETARDVRGSRPWVQRSPDR